MMMNTANGTFWAAYGIAIGDFFIIIPNSIGAMLGCVQIVLYILFPRTPVTISNGSTDEEVGDVEVDGATTTKNVDGDKKEDPIAAQNEQSGYTLPVESSRSLFESKTLASAAAAER